MAGLELEYCKACYRQWRPTKPDVAVNTYNLDDNEPFEVKAGHSLCQRAKAVSGKPCILEEVRRG